MNPYRFALSLIVKMRKIGVSSPAQQATLISILEVPGIGFTKLQDITLTSKDSLGGILRDLKAKEVIYRERPDRGQVRHCKYYPTLETAKALGVEVKS